MITWRARVIGNHAQVLAELWQGGAMRFDLVCICLPAELPDLIRQMTDALAREQSARQAADWALPARDAALNLLGGGCDACQ